MRLWPPVLIPPLAFLTLLSAAYALVPWTCEHQQRAPLHAITIVTLAIALGSMGLAWREWQSAGLEHPDDRGERVSWIRFIAVVGLCMSSLSLLATIGLWLTQFIMPQCVR
jgi:hypothetical protein